MIATSGTDGAFHAPVADVARLEAGLVEMLVLVPQEQADTLEAAAQVRGLTVGQMVRRLIGDFTSRNRMAGQGV